MKGKHLKAAVIGIGLNVNQDEFPPGLNATSMKLKTGKELSLDTVLKDLMAAFEQGFSKCLSESDEARLAYEELLFGLHEKLRFTIPKGGSLEATILGIDTTGRLKVERTDGTRAAYGFNEIRMVL